MGMLTIVLLKIFVWLQYCIKECYFNSGGAVVSMILLPRCCDTYLQLTWWETHFYNTENLQPNFNDTSSQAGLSCEKIGLLFCGQGHGKVGNSNECFNLNDIFSTAEPFVTKLSMVVHHHMPECHHAQKIGLLSSGSRSQWGLIWSNVTFYQLNCWSFCNQI